MRATTAAQPLFVSQSQRKANLYRTRRFMNGALVTSCPGSGQNMDKPGGLAFSFERFRQVWQKIGHFA